MKPEEIYKIVRKALEDGVSLDTKSLLILICIILLSGVIVLIVSYLKNKGKNLADKEDIKAITDMIESVKKEYAAKLENIVHENKLTRDQLQQRHEMRLAALEKRLEVHQQAYSLWWEMMGKASKPDEVDDYTIKCQEWFVKNSLYLTEESRDAFHKAYMAASIHPDLLRSHEKHEIIKENFAKIRRAGEILVKAVSLPSLEEHEYNPINTSKEG